jgi:hypothetical protein
MKQKAAHRHIRHVARQEERRKHSTRNKWISGTVQYCTVRYGTVRYGTVRYSTGTVPYGTVPVGLNTLQWLQCHTVSTVEHSEYHLGHS